jgi:predicted Rossmann fold nucleotide-binding protein DprA/Smf involved in DNA uptake
MQCERCKAAIEDGEEKILHGQVLCEECFMDILSPVKACDPWAVYNAKTFAERQGRELYLNQVQEKILELLREEGPTEIDKLSDRLQIGMKDLERELATLRHMEKVRGELRDKRRFIRLWD